MLGAVLPSHLSPFVEEGADDYMPVERRAQLAAAKDIHTVRGGGHPEVCAKTNGKGVCRRTCKRMRSKRTTRIAKVRVLLIANHTLLLRHRETRLWLNLCLGVVAVYQKELQDELGEE